MRRLALLILGAALPPLLSACVVHVNDSPSNRMDFGQRISIETVELEPVRAARIVDGRFHVRVDSNGCTEAESFAVHLDEADDGAVGLGLERTRPDLCKALVADGVELSWSLAELGVTGAGPYRLLNPLKL